MNERWKALSKSYASLAVILFVFLLIINLIVLPNMVSTSNIVPTIALAAPLVLASMSVTPSILSGSGGIDVSVGALLGFINVGLFTFIASLGIKGPVATLVVVVLIGAAIGAINGLLVTVVRLQPIVATLGINLILTGLGLHLLPQPGGTAPTWMTNLAGMIGPIPGPILLVGIPLLLWFLLTRLPFHRALLAVGGDDRAAYSAGVPVGGIRFTAYLVGGILAAISGLALTAVVGSGDANLGSQYTLEAIAGAVLGGTSLMGGRGGMIGALFGALDIYLIQTVLTAAKVSNFWFQVAYGVVLLAALISNSLIGRSARSVEV